MIPTAEIAGGGTAGLCILALLACCLPLASMVMR